MGGILGWEFVVVLHFPRESRVTSFVLYAGAAFLTQSGGKGSEISSIRLDVETGWDVISLSSYVQFSPEKAKLFENLGSETKQVFAEFVDLLATSLLLVNMICQGMQCAR